MMPSTSYGVSRPLPVRVSLGGAAGAVAVGAFGGAGVFVADGVGFGGGVADVVAGTATGVGPAARAAGTPPGAAGGTPGAGAGMASEPEIEHADSATHALIAAMAICIECLTIRPLPPSRIFKRTFGPQPCRTGNVVPHPAQCG